MATLPPLLIQAALELFAEHGYAGASVRDIAQKAQQNIGAISYYFGDKKGLYTAVSEEIVHDMQDKFGGLQQAIEEKLRQGPFTQEEYISSLKQLITGMVMALVRQDKHSRSVSQIFAREQFAPTHVLELLYEKIHAPMHKLCCRLIGGYLGKNPESPEIIVRAYTMFGSSLVFSMAREMIRIRTGWKTMGEKEIQLIANIVSEHIDLLMQGLRQCKSDAL